MFKDCSGPLRTIAFWLMDAEMYTGMGDDGTQGTVAIERGMSGTSAACGISMKLNLKDLRFHCLRSVIEIIARTRPSRICL